MSTLQATSTLGRRPPRGPQLGPRRWGAGPRARPVTQLREAPQAVCIPGGPPGMGVRCGGHGRVRVAQLPRAPPVPSSRARVRASCKVSLTVLVLAGPLQVPEATPRPPTPRSWCSCGIRAAETRSRGCSGFQPTPCRVPVSGDARWRAVSSSVGRPRGKEWRSLPAAVEAVLSRTASRPGDSVR